ncbi:MAG TPA: DUF4340 domain-containing protein [Bryobacteraceae bacterium]|jgi:hypothetical protein
MKPNGLMVAVALLAVLGGVVWWSNKKQEAAAKSPSDTATKLISTPEDQFQEIWLKKVTGEVIDLQRDGAKWKLVQPQPLRADQDTVSSMVSTLSSLNADKLIEDKAADLKPYGLNDPTLDIRVTRKDGKVAEVLVGDDTPTGSGAYAKMANDARVFSIGSTVKSSLDKTPDDLRDKRLLTFDSDKLTRVELQAKGGTVEFGKNGANEWQILKPRALRADGSQVDTLVTKLKDAKMDPPKVDPENAKKFAAGTKVATATVSDSSGPQTIEVHKDKDNNYYAKSTAVEGVYKIASDVGTALDKGLDDFRNKKVFDFGFSDPNKVEVRGVTYTKSGDKWTSDGKTMDNSSVQALIDKLRDLSATKFAESGGGNSIFEATVTSNDGKRVEKVTIRQQGTQYLAQRENEPSIYVLDGAAVSALQQAATDVKPEAPPAKKK